MSYKKDLALVLVLANLLCQTQPTLTIATPQAPYAGNGTSLPNVTDSGYVMLDEEAGSALFYSYYEAQEVDADRDVPVLLWLQGGPGCASHFGNLYELGPHWVNSSLLLEENPGAWNRIFGLLFIDQPLGTGFSLQGKTAIPTTEEELAAHLYVALQGFFGRHEELQERPFFITGESYAGKYVPSIGHYILQLQMESQGNGTRRSQLQHSRQIPVQMREAGAPLFRLSGLAIGNGLTDPLRQVTTHADTAHFMGMIDSKQRITAMRWQLYIQQLIYDGRWAMAHTARNLLLAFIQEASGAATLLDMRRAQDYDAAHYVDQYLNLPEVKEALGAAEEAVFVSCSDKVEAALGPDVMKSVVHLLPDVLAQLPVLLYQGQFDAQDGPATSEAWILSLDWPGAHGFESAARKLWWWKGSQSSFEASASTSPDAASLQPHVGGSKPGVLSSMRRLLHHQSGAAAGAALLQPSTLTTEGVAEEMEEFQKASVQVHEQDRRLVGYWKQHGPLTHVVIRGAGHMVPRDQPLECQAMMEKWVQRALRWKENTVKQ